VNTEAKEVAPLFHAAGVLGCPASRFWGRT